MGQTNTYTDPISKQLGAISSSEGYSLVSFCLRVRVGPNNHERVGGRVAFALCRRNDEMPGGSRADNGTALSERLIGRWIGQRGVGL